jgi:hypothetical protein
MSALQERDYLYVDVTGGLRHATHSVHDCVERLGRDTVAEAQHYDVARLESQDGHVGEPLGGGGVHAALSSRNSTLAPHPLQTAEP